MLLLVCFVARILHGGVIIKTKQLLLTGPTVLIAFVHLWELSKPPGFLFENFALLSVQL